MTTATLPTTISIRARNDDQEMIVAGKRPRPVDIEVDLTHLFPDQRVLLAQLDEGYHYGANNSYHKDPADKGLRVIGQKAGEPLILDASTLVSVLVQREAARLVKKVADAVTDAEREQKRLAEDAAKEAKNYARRLELAPLVALVLSSTPEQIANWPTALWIKTSDRGPGYRGDTFDVYNPALYLAPHVALEKGDKDLVPEAFWEKLGESAKILTARYDAMLAVKAAEKARALTDAVTLWGSDAQKAAHAAGKLRHSEIISLVRVNLLMLPLKSTDVSVESHDSDDSFDDINHVSSDAYLVLAKAEAAVRKSCLLVYGALSHSEPDYDLTTQTERLSNREDDERRGYTAMLTLNWRGIEVNVRVLLAMDGEE